VIFAEITPQQGVVGLRNREPAASGTYTSIIDEQMYISAGSPLDLTAKRRTAVPAGSNGRVRVAVSDQRKLEETGAPGTFVDFHICTFQPASGLHPIPATHAEIDAGVASLAAQGYNAIRFHGIEYLLMNGTSGVLSFDAAALDRFDYMLYACKQAGIYWVFQPKSSVLYPDCNGGSLWAAEATQPLQKSRIFIQQDSRDFWLAGFNSIYNRVNSYTGINMLQDPALLMVSAYNENSAFFVAITPSIATWRWNARDSASAQGTAGMTFPEWLADSTKAHGSANLAALNASWGTAHASFTAAAATQTGILTSASSTMRELDALLYCRYLDANMAAWFKSAIRGVGYTGLVVTIVTFPKAYYIAQESAFGNNDIWAFHQYAMQSGQAEVGVSIGTQWAIWDRLFFGATQFGYDVGKPVYCDEIGWPYWSRYRNQYPIAAAYAAMHAACGFTMFHQGDIFETQYDATAGDRTRFVDAFDGTNPVDQFAMLVSFFARKYVAEDTSLALTLVCNPNYLGYSPKSTAKLTRSLTDWYNNVSKMPAFVRTRFQWNEAASDNDWKTIYNTKSLFTWLDDLKNAGFLTADNLGYVSAAANHGSVVSYDISVPTVPVIQVASHTCQTGDYISVWADINPDTTSYKITKVDATHLSIDAGQVDASGWTGAYSWCENNNVTQTRNKEIACSRRQKWATVDTAKFKFVALGAGATKPTHVASLTLTSLDDNAALAIMSLDDAAIATSEHLLIGLVGEDQNTGSTWDAGRDVITAVGEYPIQIRDCTANITLTVANAREMQLFRLQRNGERSSRETPAAINAVTGAITLNLRTGSVYPSCWFELIRR